MKKIFVFLMAFSILLANAIAADQKSEEIKVSLSIETVAPEDEETIVGFSSTPIANWNTEPTKIPTTGITLTPDTANGSFSYDSTLYAYAKILNSDVVTIDFQASPLKGYKSGTDVGEGNNLADPDATLNWILATVDDNPNNLYAEDIMETIDNENEKILTVFHHNKPGSEWVDKNSNVYCVELDISSPDPGVQDYRQVAAENGVNYWETTLTVLVHSGN